MISNALEQTTSASSPNYIDVLKYVGTALAAVAAIMRAIPQVSSYLSRRNTMIYQSYRLRVLQMNKPAPWRNFKEHPKMWVSETYRRIYLLAFSVFFGISALFFAALFVLFIIDIRSSSHSFSSSISLYIATAFYGSLSIFCVKWSYDYGGKKYEQWSPSKKETSFTVAGSKEDVLQHCFIALNSIGAFIVNFDEAQGTIAASRGLWIRGLWTGQRILVSVSYDRGQTDRVTVAMSSDDFNPTYMLHPFSSPHARNVKGFVNQWIFSKARIVK